MSTEVSVRVNGEALVLDAAGALWWPEERTLVFADLHFEKGSAFAKRGQLLPPYDTRTTLRRMESLLDRYAPARVIALGDSFHDRTGAERLDEHERECLVGFGRSAEWIWIAGNHDPAPPSWLGGRVCDELAIASLVFRHEPLPAGATGEIAGHLHPCKHVTRRGRTMRRRCFASDGLRLVMPAFGAYTGGLDVRDRALQMLFGSDFISYVLGSHRVYAIAA